MLLLKVVSWSRRRSNLAAALLVEEEELVESVAVS